MITVNYAMQLCDTKSRDTVDRVITDDRTLISKKCLMSFLESIQCAVETGHPAQHRVALIVDKCTPDLLRFCELCQLTYSGEWISVEIIDLHPKSGITDSIRACYQWLTDNVCDIVFQVQDDYLFETTAIVESLDVWFQVAQGTAHHPIVQPFNDIHNWRNAEYMQHPLMMILGSKRYWIEIYDTSCSFMTSHGQFIRHWDLYDRFFDLLDSKAPRLESDSLNHMMSKRNIIGVTPVQTLSHHLQTELDPYNPPHKLWNKIDLDKVMRNQTNLKPN
jgi:hypothetical protein